jgi:uncharacterized membrane protein YheB (UPF0754 family)
MILNKSFVTNLVSAVIAVVGLLLPGTLGEVVAGIGFFAFSGAITNWLAVYMLFEKVPGFYGSGVIPARFTEFRSGIRQLVMGQFFNPDNVQQFFSMMDTKSSAPSVLQSVAAKVDFNHAFDGLVEVIMQSSFGTMLGMFGGANALKPLREPFVGKMQEFLQKVGEDKEILGQLAAHNSEALLARVQAIVDKRLDELTPQLVKEIIEKMILLHLGWLVVWGGVVGGLLGLLVELIELAGYL